MTEVIASREPLLPSQPGQEISRNEELLDDELLQEEMEGTEEPRGERLRPSWRFFCTMALTGVVLALGWRYTGIAEQADRLWSSITSVPASASAAAKVADEPLAPILAELNGLKAEVARLSAANQQIAATIASLLVQQRELQQRLTSASAATNLFSDPKLMQFSIVPGKRSLTTGSTARLPTATGPRPTASADPVRGETRRLPAPKPANAPLALAPPN
jgi:hypothetical protein